MDNLNVSTLSILDKVKNNYILKQIFCCLNKKNLLQILIHNKNIQKRINLNIDNYKDYSGQFASTIIEVKPVENKNGKFINISEEDEEKKYFHIYFNDNKEEIKRYDIKEKDEITNIKIIIDYQIKSFKNLFSFCDCIESIYFNKFVRNNIEDMSYMLYKCSSLKEVNISNYNINNNINMSYMFFECTMLTKIELSKFKVNNINNMSNMFSGCESLKEINISNFKINNKTNLNFIFCGCSSLNSLKFCNFNNYNLDGIESMFFGCSEDFINSIKNDIT